MYVKKQEEKENFFLLLFIIKLKHETTVLFYVK